MNLISNDVKARAVKIKMLVLDVDGVLTDGRLYLAAMPDGVVETKVFHTRDGHGLKLMMESGIEVGVISGRKSDVVTHRMNELGVRYVYQGIGTKLPVFEQLLKDAGVSADQVAYMGDDFIDADVMRLSGLGVAVADAHTTAIEAADWVTNNNGGFGAVRELCDIIMDAQANLTPEES